MEQSGALLLQSFAQKERKEARALQVCRDVNNSSIPTAALYLVCSPGLHPALCQPRIFSCDLKRQKIIAVIFRLCCFSLELETKKCLKHTDAATAKNSREIVLVFTCMFLYVKLKLILLSHDFSLDKH